MSAVGIGELVEEDAGDACGHGDDEPAATVSGTFDMSVAVAGGTYDGVKFLINFRQPQSSGSGSNAGVSRGFLVSSLGDSRSCVELGN